MVNLITRREALKTTATLMGAGFSLSSFIQNTKKEGFKIGACDLSINKINESEAADVGAKLGLDGVQVNLGNLANNMHLRDLKIQREYTNNFKKNNIKFSGLAIGELNNIPYKSDDRTDQWVSDSIDVAKVIGVKNVLLAFFEFLNNDFCPFHIIFEVIIAKKG